ncbi:rab9 effector protein with kelch motifs isoform X1 [Phascolarctos cinereus]|uniref:Rab9 effector protein with kelch motifs n=1 Tax=Phascolarctos cinereus TaxID=38626 RepID=A0A6P5IMG7_PHACI|nr:rab9 effector protein with kelch motifs isoform X1 [Phascolarctos cinereus]XP_020823210.1 rab9 effector protein with kelch motifs isoform X1 [Phascolarctos cinereus]XP_020823211.1 rab9 effector protein with kelch motifs isoform X1 [Phascolarctos cinereus]XP_020823212.1 rab9 effector protein with kelch motifs isoform X1 [Phascolarctos cinereus]XP_020823213.1 rab9 effector protein with kelch motifs isoform X1 [Phascolarctos cinereus]
MKLLQVLEPGDCPQKATWYALAPPGHGPCARVGHNCLYLPPGQDTDQGKVFVVGGANPNGSFSDVYYIDLATYRWKEVDCEGLLARYEHASFLPLSTPGRIWVFGGADQSGNRNCLQALDLETRIWSTPNVTGTPPSPRTFHTASAVIGNQLYVFGGGEKGAKPVQDTQLHIFDATTLSWSHPETCGEPPLPRHGHVMVALGPKLFVHGGLAGDEFYNDLYCIDTNDMKWEKLEATGDVPSGCAAHSAVAIGKHIYIFGGMAPTGALATMYQYHIEKQHWSLLKFDTYSPPGRLDHSMCVIPWHVAPASAEEHTHVGSVNSNVEKEGLADEIVKGDDLDQKETDTFLCLVFGGMNTEGEIYNDCVVTLVD